MKNFVDENIKGVTPKHWLSSEFIKRRRKNKSYSIRSFANLVKLDPSTLSQILSGKRLISGKMVGRLTEILGVDPKTKSALLQYANKKIKINQLEVDEKKDEFRQLTLDAYTLISDWYHYALLELTYVQNFKNDHKWIAKELGITTAEVAIALERLKRLELIEEVNGRLMKTEAFITNFQDGITSQALKNLQRNILTMALDAIDNTPAEEKDISSMTFAINEKKLPEARKKIKNFRREMTQLLENGIQTKVYHLGIQLYPINNKKKEGTK